MFPGAQTHEEVHTTGRFVAFKFHRIGFFFLQHCVGSHVRLCDSVVRRGGSSTVLPTGHVSSSSSRLLSATSFWRNDRLLASHWQSFQRRLRRLPLDTYSRMSCAIASLFVVYFRQGNEFENLVAHLLDGALALVLEGAVNANMFTFSWRYSTFPGRLRPSGYAFHGNVGVPGSSGACDGERSTR